MSFTDQKPWIVTEKDVNAQWGLERAPASKNFRCAWCGHVFQVGDTARWVYTNNTDAEDHISMNPFICDKCDGPRDEILARLKERAREFYDDRFWWFRKRIS